MSPSAAGPLVPTTRGKDDDRALVPMARVLGFEHSERSRPTCFRSAARGLHVPAILTPECAKGEARKRRANERPRVGCCEELARWFFGALMAPGQRVLGRS